MCLTHSTNSSFDIRTTIVYQHNEIHAFLCYVILELREAERRKMKWARHKFVLMSILCRVYIFFFWHFSFVAPSTTIPCLPAGCRQWKFNEYVNWRQNVQMLIGAGLNQFPSRKTLSSWRARSCDSTHPSTMIKSWKSMRFCKLLCTRRENRDLLFQFFFFVEFQCNVTFELLNRPMCMVWCDFR